MGTAPRARNSPFPPQCVTTSFCSSPPTTLIQNSPSSKPLVKEGGGRCYLCCSSHYCLHCQYYPLLLSEPLDYLMTKTFVGRFPRTAIFCGDWSSICAGALCGFHTWSILTMVQLPHVLHRPGAPHVPEYPRGSRTGFAHPVDRFRWTLSPVALTILAFSFGGIAAGSFLAPEFLISKWLVCWMQILVCCLHLVCWISVCWMQALVCCLPLVCRIWYAVCILYAGFSFTFLRVYSSKCWTCSFFVRASLFCIYYSFFCKFEWAIFALFSRFFFGFYVFLTLDTELGHKFIFWLSGVIDMLARWFAPWAGPRTGERWTGQKFHFFLQLW